MKKKELDPKDLKRLKTDMGFIIERTPLKIMKDYAEEILTNWKRVQLIKNRKKRKEFWSETIDFLANDNLNGILSIIYQEKSNTYKENGKKKIH